MCLQVCMGSPCRPIPRQQHRASAQAAELLDFCEGGAWKLLEGGRWLAQVQSAQDCPQQLREEAAAAVEALGQQLVAADEDRAASPAARARRLQQLLPAAERVASVVHQYQALPGPSLAILYEVATAAAGRSCAYLRCPNVEAGGGPAAGQGAGSMRCR